MDQIDPRYLVVRLVKILNNLKIPYLITGGIAVLLWGRVRFTADIDIIVELQQKDITKLEKALKDISETGYVDKFMIEEALRNYGEFNFIDGDSGVKVDFWVLKNDEFDRSRLSRRKIKSLLGQDVYVSSPEDLILVKLQWHKTSQSSRHLEDVESILKISGEQIDRGYLKDWAKRLRVEDELKKFLPL